MSDHDQKQGKPSHPGKIIAWILGILIFLLCLVPVPRRIKDGGSIALQPIVPAYSITMWNGIGTEENTRTAGATIELFGIRVFSDYHEEPIS